MPGFSTRPNETSQGQKEEPFELQEQADLFGRQNIKEMKGYNCCDRFTCFVVPGILDEVGFEDAHQDGGQEACEKQDGDTGVHDAEPMDLQAKPSQAY